MSFRIGIVIPCRHGERPPEDGLIIASAWKVGQRSNDERSFIEWAWVFLSKFLGLFGIAQHLIQWTFNRERASIDHMCVDHRGFHILVPEQFLYCADVITGFEQVCGEFRLWPQAALAKINPLFLR